MRILHRYVSLLFLSATLLFLISFTFLFVLVDFVAKSSVIFALEKVSIVPFIFQYYALRFPIVVLYVLPVATLFGAVFTILRLGKTNELAPMVTAGVSLRRLSIPFAQAALLCGILIGMLEELVLPAVSVKLAEMEEIIISRETSWGVTARDEKGFDLYARVYDHTSRTLTGVSLVHIKQPNVIRLSVEAARGEWDAERGRWIFYNGDITNYDKEGHPHIIQRPGERPIVIRSPIPAEGYKPNSAILPANFRRMSLLTASTNSLVDILQKIARHPNIPSFEVQLHTKLAFPLSPIVLLLVGLPFVFALGTQGVLRGLFLCLVVTFLFFSAHFVAVDLGHRAQLSPALAGWAPTAVFGAAGLVFFARIRT